MDAGHSISKSCHSIYKHEKALLAQATHITDSGSIGTFKESGPDAGETIMDHIIYRNRIT